MLGGHLRMHCPGLSGPGASSIHGDWLTAYTAAYGWMLSISFLIWLQDEPFHVPQAQKYCTGR